MLMNWRNAAPQWILIAAIAMALAASRFAWADEYVYQLWGNDHQPLSNAVIEFESTSFTMPTGAKPVVMDQVNYQFKPRVLAVVRGQPVVFPNSDQVRHQVYSFSSAKTFEIKLFKGIAESPVIFDKPGLVTLGCNIHDDMLGYIYVANSSCFGVSDNAGRLAVNCKERPQQASLWHPGLSLDATSKMSVRIPQVGQVLDVVSSSNAAVFDQQPRSSMEQKGDEADRLPRRLE